MGGFRVGRLDVQLQVILVQQPPQGVQHGPVHQLVAEFQRGVGKAHGRSHDAGVGDDLEFDVQGRRQQVVVLQEQLHHLSQVATGHEGLPQDRVGAEVEAQAQVQSQGGIAG